MGKKEALLADSGPLGKTSRLSGLGVLSPVDANATDDESGEAKWGTVLPQFRPSWWLRGPHAQTIFGSLLKETPLPPDRSFSVTLEDGDSVCLHQNLPGCWQHDRHGRPVVLLSVHGLGGCYRSGYVRRLAGLALARGWASYRMDMRGAGESGRQSQYLYHAGRSDDLLAAVKAVGERHPDASVIVCGFSLGASITLHLMSHLADQIPEYVTGAAVVGPPLDLTLCAQSLMRFENRLYDRKFARLLWATLQQRPNVLERFADVLPSKAPRSLLEFDQQVTAPLGGYASAWDYYREFSTVHRLPDIRKPTLILTAKDDPIIPWSMFQQVANAEAITFRWTNRGGHLGFIGGKGRGSEVRSSRWAERYLIQAISGLVGMDQHPGSP